MLQNTFNDDTLLTYSIIYFVSIFIDSLTIFYLQIWSKILKTFQ